MQTKWFLIADPTLMEGAQVQATSEASDELGASNLLLPYPGDLWVAPQVGGLEVTLQLDLQDGEEWDFVAPLYANFGPACTWQVSAAASEAGLLSPTFQTDPIPGQLNSSLAHRSHEWVHSFAWQESDEWLSQGSRSETWIRIHVYTVDPKLPSGYSGPAYVQWGGVRVAKAWQPPHHVERGSRQRRIESPRRGNMETGGVRLGARRRRRKASYKIQFLTRDESLVFTDELDRRVGESGHVVTIFNPYDLDQVHREMLYGVLDSTDRVHHDTDVYSKDLVVSEVW